MYITSRQQLGKVAVSQDVKTNASKISGDFRMTQFAKRNVSVVYVLLETQHYSLAAILRSDCETLGALWDPVYMLAKSSDFATFV